MRHLGSTRVTHRFDLWEAIRRHRYLDPRRDRLRPCNCVFFLAEARRWKKQA
jgi:hypothetical protein